MESDFSGIQLCNLFLAHLALGVHRRLRVGFLEFMHAFGIAPDHAEVVGVLDEVNPFLDEAI